MSLRFVKGEETKKVWQRDIVPRRGKVLNVLSLLYTSFIEKFFFFFFWKPETKVPICNSVTGNSGFLFNKEKHLHRIFF